MDGTDPGRDVVPSIGLGVGSSGGGADRADAGDGSGPMPLLLLSSLLDRSTWFLSRHNLMPAQNRSKVSKPLGSVTLDKQLISPLGKYGSESSSSHWDAMSVKRTQPVPKPSIISNNSCNALTNCLDIP